MVQRKELAASLHIFWSWSYPNTWRDIYLKLTLAIKRMGFVNKPDLLTEMEPRGLGNLYNGMITGLYTGRDLRMHFNTTTNDQQVTQKKK
jgi:hypothetical protein